MILVNTMMFALNLHYSFSQCYTAGTGTEDYSYSNLTVNGATGSINWNNKYVKISGNVQINNTYTLTITGGSKVDMTTGDGTHFILVKSGGTLIINDHSQLYSSGGWWVGIEVEPGGTVTVTGTTDGTRTTIANANRGIDAYNGTSESLVTVNGGNPNFGPRFCNCEIGIFIRSYTGSSEMQSEISNTLFISPLFPDGGGDEGDYGIYVKDVRPTYGTPDLPFLIGDASRYADAGAHFNEFRDVNVGIRVKNSNVKIQDNYIHELAGDSEPDAEGGEPGTMIFRTGIFVTGTEGTAPFLEIGEVDDYPLTDDENNLIENADKGIIVNGYVNTRIWQNNIISDYIDDDDTYKMSYGIIVAQNCPLVDLMNNTISNFIKDGIHVEDNPDATSIYIGQTSAIEYGEFAPSLHPTGYFVTESGAFTGMLTIEINEAVEVQNGIVVENMEAPGLSNNAIHYEAHDNGGMNDIAHGIKLSNCPYAIIADNWCEGNFGDLDPGDELYVQGIHAEECAGFLIDANWSASAGYGIYVTFTSTDGNFTCNGINDDCPFGIYLLDIGGTPIASPLADEIGGSSYPSGNHWFPDDAANRVTTDQDIDVTDCRATQWYYYDDPEQYNISPGLVVELSGSYAPDFNYTTGDQCLAVLEGRFTNTAELEHDFANWAYAINENLVEPSPESWSIQYQFWSRVLENQIVINELSAPLQELYYTVGSSNIPSFISLAELMSHRNYEAAVELVNSISPSNDIEYYWRQVSLIYLNNINEEGIFELSPEDAGAVRDIAVLNGRNGPGIYEARAMLDTVIEHLRIIPEVKAIGQSEKSIHISPNPAQTFINLTSNDPDYLKKQVISLDFFNVTGAIIKHVNYEQNLKLDIGDVPNGIYLIKINTEDNTKYFNKLEVIK